MRRLLETFTEKADGRTVVVAPLAGWYNVFNPKLASSYLARFQGLAAPEDRVHVINVLPYFLELTSRERAQCFLPGGDDHYTALGHTVVAGGLLTEMSERGIDIGPARALEDDPG